MGITSAGRVNESHSYAGHMNDHDIPAPQPSQQLDRSFCGVGATCGQRGFSFIAAPSVDSAAYDVPHLLWKVVAERAWVITHCGFW